MDQKRSTGDRRKAASQVGAASPSRLDSLRASATRRRVFVASLAVCASIFTSTYGVAEEAALWRALGSGGHVALLRHAIAPGTGDPPGFKLEDCSTQRNLSAAGRSQAERIGEQFRANGIDTARVFASQWCRCIDTAKYLGLGPVESLPVLNSFFQNRRDGDRRTKELMNWLDTLDLVGVTVLVTHQVNITALTGVFPESGAMIIVRRSRPGTLSVVGTMNPQ